MFYKYCLLLFKIVDLKTKVFRYIFSNIPLRLRGMKIGSSTYIPNRHSISWPHRVCFGERNQINDGLVIREYSSGSNLNIGVKIRNDNFLSNGVIFELGNSQSRLTVGNKNYFGAGVILSATKEISIGSNCKLAAGCALFDFNHGMEIGAGPMGSQECDESPITIEDDVWLGAGVKVLKGVTIGEGAIVGSGSVVTKSIKPYEIWAGVPAKKIGQRK
ncbi:Succinyltransferase-like protein [uncultured Thiomicrorhabdus sp.]